MKKISHMFILIFALGFAAEAKEKIPIGSKCKSDADCQGGICYNLLDGEIDFCEAKICTLPCKTDADCKGVPGKASCDSVTKKACITYDWVTPQNNCNPD